MHPIVTVPTYKMQPIGTVSTDKMHPVGKEQPKLDLKQTELKPRTSLWFQFQLSWKLKFYILFRLGYAKIGCLAEILAETEIKDNFSAQIGYFGE